MVGRFRLGLAVGLVAGYVLGTKAGRERYLQMQRTVRQAARIGSKVGSSSLTKVVARKAGEESLVAAYAAAIRDGERRIAFRGEECSTRMKAPSRVRNKKFASTNAPRSAVHD